MAIHVLQDEVIALIAAGEVVERPASALRELVENALDAGASHIEVSVDGGGRSSIQVSDNGHGIRAAELELAFQRHATSKLGNADDLNQIRTLGFRGEALASIAAVSRLRVRTRATEEKVGSALLLEGGDVVEREALGAPAGTLIGVENLFYNVPARLKFLKSPLTEKRHIAQVISRYALAWPQVRFTLEMDGRESFRSSGNGELADVLVATLGHEAARDMIAVGPPATHGGGAQVSGYTSAPGLNRGDRSRITLFVNGRHVQDSSLIYAVIQAYHTLLMKGRFPLAVLMITLPPDQVDVNVHPAKSEVRFQRPGEIFSAVQRAVRNAVLGASSPAGRSDPDKLSRAPEYESPSPAADSAWSGRSRATLRVEDDSALTAFPAGPEGPQRPRTLPLLRVIGQIGASFIVAEGPAGMYLIDQHAAHERILYEQFMERQSREVSMSQLTLAAQTLELPAAEANLVEASRDELRVIGFELEPFGMNTFLIRSIPALLADVEPREAVRGALEELEQGHSPGAAPVEQRLIRRVCKQAAVKAGTVLSREEMQGLVSQLERTQSPLTCPHGRPTLLHMSAEQLAREFGRR